MEKSVRLHITGIVQGVGFRPFVYNLAGKYRLRGFCLNDGEGVIIEVQGSAIGSFIDELRSSPPPLSKIEDFREEEVLRQPFSGFTIKESIGEAGQSTLVSPDVALCTDCERELFDHSDRRYLYPFINCTNCGPRYSIVLDIPYDRPKTTMARFNMCPACEAEYKDPNDRRFHAQPNACADCGPKVWLEKKGERSDALNFEAIRLAQRLLENGKILAIKGLGGFHLACDAGNSGAVARLRELKRKSLSRQLKSNKPFALMAPDMKTIKEFAFVNKKEAELLEGRIKPIVLLEKKGSGALSGDVSPKNGFYGFMLPYTPLHHLLFHGAFFKALVMTSGNLSEEPIVIANEEAVKKLYGIADAFLLHDRAIYMRVDDSIARVDGKRKKVLRRARGFTPYPIAIDVSAPDVLACGAELKNTFCVTKGSNAIMSQHIGDLETSEALEFFEETLENLKNTFRAKPAYLAYDMHPDYLGTKFAKEYAEKNDIKPDKMFAVQHHHAHIASVMAEHGIKDEVIGVAFDGTGYGTDGRIWGAEFLIADRNDFRRAAHFDYIRLPGGERAIKEPWRTALSYVIHSYGDEAGEAIKTLFRRLDKKDIKIVSQMIRSNINSPLASSAGRLFDAISSIIGLKDFITFEGEAAIELENAASKAKASKAYKFEVAEGEPFKIDFRQTIREIIKDISADIDKAVIARKFHNTIARVIVHVAQILRNSTGINKVVLSGGVFQNRLLSKLSEKFLTEKGFEVFMNEKTPANDGGISLGQAIIAIERSKG